MDVGRIGGIEQEQLLIRADGVLGSPSSSLAVAR